MKAGIISEKPYSEKTDSVGYFYNFALCIEENKLFHVKHIITYNRKSMDHF